MLLSTAAVRGPLAAPVTEASNHHLFLFLIICSEHFKADDAATQRCAPLLSRQHVLAHRILLSRYLCCAQGSAGTIQYIARTLVTRSYGTRSLWNLSVVTA
jgi:hypothetical protein